MMNYLLIIFLFSSIGLNPTSVETSCQSCSIYIPNAFSPNNDSRNDEFFINPEAACQFADFSVHIFSRWGELIYTSENPDFRWNGKVNNQDVPQAVYLYAIKYTLIGADDSNQESLIGHLNLIR